MLQPTRPPRQRTSKTENIQDKTPKTVRSRGGILLPWPSPEAQGGSHGEGTVSRPGPNKRLQATANSLRSCLAPAIGSA